MANGGGGRTEEERSGATIAERKIEMDDDCGGAIE
jgi:hypothetical protein